MRLATAAAVLLSTTLLAATATAKTWHIVPDGSGDAPTIQAGIDSAAVGDTVLLGDGTFTGVGNQDLDLHGKAVVVRSESGNPEACVIDCEGSESDPHRAFYFHSGEGAGAVLEGVKIVNGLAPGSIPFGLGGGVLCDSASVPTIRGCVFEGNEAWVGGGICWANGSSGWMVDCVLRGNRASAGGGLASRQSGPILDGCVFFENATLFDGENYESYGAGADFWESPALVTGCVFERNDALTELGVGLGGAVSVYTSGDIRFSECRFSENSGEYGGGVYVLTYYSARNVVLSKCILEGNEAEDGGGLYVLCGEGDPPPPIPYVHVDSCTFSDNVATTGSGISDVGNSIETSSTIISFGRGSSAVFSYPTTSPCGKFSCCDIYGNEGGDWVGCIANQSSLRGNFSGDPLFCDPEEGDFTLDAGSPCLNAPGCGLVGALGEGCAVTGIGPSSGPVLPVTTRFLVTPNPGKGAFTIQFGRAPALHTTIQVFDIAGRLVRVLYAPGPQGSVVWDGRDSAGRDVSPGVYFVRLSDRAHTEARRVLLVR